MSIKSFLVAGYWDAKPKQIKWLFANNIPESLHNLRFNFKVQGKQQWACLDWIIYAPSIN